jgi:hypothetical protein
MAALSLTGAVLSCYADGAIGLENFTVNNPVYLNSVGNIAPATPDTWIQVLSGGVALSQPFNLVMDGFFDNGPGIVTGVNGPATVDVVVRGWVGADYATASKSVEKTIAGQKVGAVPAPPAPPTLEPLQLPADFVIAAPIPEPSTVALVLLGGAALLLRRRK